MIISADEHVVEPLSFWEGWLVDSVSAEDRSRVPRRVGAGLALDGDSGPGLRTFTLFPELLRHSDDAPGADDPQGRVAVLDREGIDIALVFPQRAMAMWGMRDRDLMFRCLDAYNTWLASWCTATNGRVHGVAILPTVYRPEATRDYIAQLVSLGFHTFMLPGSPQGISYVDPALSPLWEAIEDAGLPLNFHVSESPHDNGPGGLGTYLAVSFQPFRKLWSFLAFSGILERYPGLRLVFTEGGISWIPSALEHADSIRRDFGDHLEPKLSSPPSELWFRQCYATFMNDPRGLEQVEHIGVERIMWSSDYPHPEGTHGATGETLDEVRRLVGPRDAPAVTGLTAARVYGLERPAEIA